MERKVQRHPTSFPTPHKHHVSLLISTPTRKGHVLVRDEPTLTIIILQSPPFTLGLTLGSVYSMGLDGCVMTCIHRDNIIEKSFTARKTPCALPGHRTLLPMPWQTSDLFTVFTVLPFLERPRVGTRQYGIFPD